MAVLQVFIAILLMQLHQLQMHLSMGYELGPQSDSLKHPLIGQSGSLMARNPALRLDDYLPYLVNRVGAALVSRFSREALARHELTIDMWRVLVALSNGSGKRQIDLSAMTSIEKSTVSRLVTKLMQSGLVTRRRSRTSSREVVVQLSAKGQSLVARLVPIAVELERLASRGTSPADMAAMKRVLRQAYDNLVRSAG
jgi:DNA-binding MarR family transcriptional regulator